MAEERRVEIDFVTAYGIAVKHGYKGTEEEWNAEQMRLRNEAAASAQEAKDAVAGAKAAIVSECNTQMAAVKKQGEQVLASIPEEYSAFERTTFSVLDFDYNYRVIVPWSNVDTDAYMFANEYKRPVILDAKYEVKESDVGQKFLLSCDSAEISPDTAYKIMARVYQYGSDDKLVTYADQKFGSTVTVANGCSYIKVAALGVANEKVAERRTFHIKVSGLAITKIGKKETSEPAPENRIVAVSNMDAQSYADRLPAYWTEDDTAKTTYLQDRVATVLSLGFPRFAFYTDGHNEGSTGQAEDIAGYVATLANIPYVFNGGDLFTRYGTRAEAIYWFKKFAGRMYSRLGTKAKYIFGNHDINTSNATTETYPNISIPYQDIYKYGILPMQGNVYEDIPTASRDDWEEYWAVNQLHYYCDDTENKIRYIVLDSGAPVSPYGGSPSRLGTQKRWLANVLLSTKDGYGVVVLTHMFFGGYGTYDVPTITNTEATNIAKMLSDAKSKANTTGYGLDKCGDIEIIAAICGHVHADWGEKIRGVQFIATTTDDPKQAYFYPNLAPTMTVGTTTENSIDVISIDRRSKKIYCTRIGAGEDRVFDY